MEENSAIKSKYVEAEEENPISFDLIENGLYLGNVTAACSIKTLQSLQITHILSIDSFQLPDMIRNISTITNKFVQISDMPKEDLLQHFEDCIKFIESALANDKNILVHCYYGMSRSSTIVIAYLMKKYKIRYEKAYEKAKAKRKLVCPNSGFVQQLKLFYKMNFTIDPNNKKYKIYRLRLAAEKIRLAHLLPSNFMDLIKPDPALLSANPESTVYRCRKCRRILFSKSNRITHIERDTSYESPQHTSRNTRYTASEATSSQPIANYLVLQEQAAFSEHVGFLADKVRSASFSDKSSSDKEKETPRVCNKMYFVEPISWMKEVCHNVQGRLYCPKCQSKLGSFNWVMASKCPCGSKVDPAFYLVPSKVEYSNIVQNIVQVTI